MQRAFHAMTALLCLCYLMTAVIGDPGADSYHLVIKPYPSLLKRIPQLEESGWRHGVATGEIPSWVVDQQYLEIGHGAFELDPSPWEIWYDLFCLLTWVSLIASVLAFFRFLYRSAKKFLN